MNLDAPGYREPPAIGDLKGASGRILAALEPRVFQVAVEVFDAGWCVGVAIQRAPDGKRHAVRGEVGPNWEREAVDKLLEWLDHGGGARGSN